MMERLYEILEDIQPGVNYKECENLIDGHFLDSLVHHRPGGGAGG